MLILAVLLAVFAISLGNLWAKPESKTESMRQKAKWAMDIAKEQLKRRLYKQAEQTLESTDKQYATYLTDDQSKTLAELLGQAKNALAQRQKIVRLLKASDDFAAQNRYLDAINQLNMIKDSEYITESEKNQILTSLGDLEKKLQVHQKQARELFNKSVDLYLLGQLEDARAGFAEVLLSQTEVKSKDGKTSQDYINIINVALTKAKTNDIGIDVEDELIEAEPAKPKPEPEPKPEPAVEPAPEPEPKPAPEPEKLQPVEPQPQPAVAQPAEPKTRTYVDVIEQKNRVVRNYTRAIVVDALTKTENSLIQKDFDRAKQSLARAVSTVRKNRLLLGDELYKQFDVELTLRNQQIKEAQTEYNAAQAEKKRIETDRIAKGITEDIDRQRQKAVEDYMANANSFVREQRYEEALGQLEQLLVIEPLNEQALILKQTLDDTVSMRKHIEIQKQNAKEEVALLLRAEGASIPYAEEITYVDNWKELAARRDKQTAKAKSTADVAAYKQLEQIVDLSMLTEETTFAEAIDILRKSVDPPLAIIVLWGDLSENAFIEQDKPIEMSGQGLFAVTVKTGLESLLQAVGSGGFEELDYVVDEGVIKIATVESLPTKLVNKVYDVSELFSAPASFDILGMFGGQGGQGGGGQGGGGGGGLGGGGGGLGGGGGGGIGGGGGGLGGGGGGLGGGGGGQGGGGGGQGGGGGGDQIIALFRSYQIMYIIQQTIEPDSWEEEGVGEGRIFPFSGKKLSVWQTPEIHEQIREFLDAMKKRLGEQVAIEARFLVVSENFLEDIGLDVTLSRLNLGNKWNSPDIEGISATQGSYEAVAPGPTTISTSLPGVLPSIGGVMNPPALFSTISYGSGLDDLQVEFVIRAAQVHANSKVLTAPKITVLNGESALFSVQTLRNYVSNVEFDTETITQFGDVALTLGTWTKETDIIPTGITMTIAPYITEDKKYVLLRITTNLNSLLQLRQETVQGFNPGTGAPVTDRFELPEMEYTTLMTRVSVPDQGTVLLGGLTLTAEKDIEAGVPILSKIPIINRFFSNRSEVKDKQILLVLVKPTIILRDEAEEDAIAAME
jgi:general secretion pathway protein D